MNQLPEEDLNKMKPSNYVYTIVGIVLYVGFSNPAFAVENLTCDQVDDEESLLWVRYLDTGVRKTFDVTVKIPPAASRGIRNRTWSVSIGKQKIGQVAFAPKRDGGLTSSLSFDSYANDGLADPGVTPFPKSWPLEVEGGSVVQVGNLYCELVG